MNFKFTQTKTIVSLLAGLGFGAFSWWTYACIGSCVGNVFLQKLLSFVVVFLIVSILTYLIWSLIQKK